MEITASNFPMSLKADLRVTYEEGRRAASNADWRNLTTIEPTTSNSKIVVFYGDKNRLRRFRGERQPQKFNEYKQVITLDDWEYTETVKRQVLDDDQSGGQLKRKVGNFAKAVDTSLQIEAEEYLRKGTSQTCFDTNQYFGRNHVYTDTSGATRGTLWTNFEVGGSQLDATTVQLEQQHFANLKGDTDKKLGMRLTHVGVANGSINHKTAMELANSQYTIEVSTSKGANTTNVFQGAFGIIPFDYGLGDSEWYGFDLSGPEKPMMVLNHSVSPGIDNMDYTQLLENSDTGFWRNEFAFGVFGRFDFNPGDPRTARLHGTTTWTSEFAEDLERNRVLEPNSW